MSTIPERLANNRKVAELVAMAANGDAAAGDYLMQLASAARICDDLIDGDVAVFPAATEQMVAALLVRIPTNPFFQTHFRHLTGLHAVAWNAWLDANSLEGGDPTDKIYAHVLRDLINEVLPQVALLTGGYAHMREVSIRMRQMFKKECE